MTRPPRRQSGHGRRHEGERGYASLAAILIVAVLAGVATMLVARKADGIAEARAELGQAQASGDAAAGLAIALDGLLVGDRAGRWSIDGRERQVTFDGAQLTIRVEDERGKVPLNLLDEEFARRLVAQLGVGDGERARIMADSLLDWTDNDDDPRPYGAEAPWYAARNIRPRNAPLQSLDELAGVRGFDAAAVDRLRGFATVHFGAGSFDARYATPEALAVMLEGGADNPEVIQRRREVAGQRTAIELGEAVDLVGRPLTIAVAVRRDGNVRLTRKTVIELTGSPAAPYIVRSGY